MWRRLVDVFRRRRLDADLDAQLAHHLDALEAEYRAHGLTHARRTSRTGASSARIAWKHQLFATLCGGQRPWHRQWKPRMRLASQSSIVVKYDGTNRWSELISALLPTFASNMSWFAFGTTTSV